MNTLLIIALLYVGIITIIVYKIDGLKSGILIFSIFALIFLFFSGIEIREIDSQEKALERIQEDIDYLEEGVLRQDTFKDKYQVETIKLEDGSLLIKIFNERDVYVDADCFVKFYDNGKAIDIPNHTYITDIAPKSYGYGIVYDYPNSNISYKKYQSDEVKVYITPRNHYNSYHCEKDIEYGYNKEEGQIYGINKYDGYIDELHFGIIYYDDNGKIIDYKSRPLYDKIPPNGEFTIKNYSNDGKIEVFIESALCKRT